MPPRLKPRPKRAERNNVVNEVKPIIIIDKIPVDNDIQTPSETSSPTPNPAQESVTSRPSGKSTSLEHRQRSASTTKRDASMMPMSNTQLSMATKCNLLNMCVNAFWKNVLSTPFESRELVEGSIGYQMSEAERSSWEAASAVQSMWAAPHSYIEHDDAHDSATQDAILKYNFASLFIKFLTSPYDIGERSIEKFLSSLIKHQEFIKDSKQEHLLLKFLIEYEIQKWMLIEIGIVKNDTPSLFSDLKVKKKTLLDLIHLLDRNHHHLNHNQEVIPEFEKSTVERFEESYQTVYQTLHPLRKNPKKIAETHPYTKFIELIIDVVCSRFPEYVRPTKQPVVQQWGESSSTPRPSHTRNTQLQASGEKSSHLAPGVRSSPRRSGPSDRVTSKEGPSGRVSQTNYVESEEDDDNSFCEEHLLPSSTRQETSLPASHDGPSAGSAQARHHENVAGEVAATAGFCNFAEEQLEKNPKFFSSRHSHPSGGPQDLDRPSSQQRTSVPSTSPRRKFNERKANAKQINFDDTQTTIQEEVVETVAELEDQQEIEVSPKSSVESSAPQPNSPSKDDPNDSRSTENMTLGHEEGVEQSNDTSKDKGKGKEVKTSKSSKRGQHATESSSRPKKQHKRDHKSDDSDDRCDDVEGDSEKVKKPWTKTQSQKATTSRSKSQRATNSSKSQKGSTSKHFEKDTSAEEAASAEEVASPTPQNKKASSKAPSTKPTKRRRSSSSSSDSTSFSKAAKRKAAKVASPPTQKRRQRWTEDQEELLIKEVVKYCDRYDCMAHILRRHGTNGSKSQLLGNRTNVMLKDKAIQISTKWAREGTKLEKAVRIAFARFPPKSGEFRRMSSVSEDESSAKQSSKEEDEDEDEDDKIIEEFASDESKGSDKKSEEVEEEGNRIIHQVLNEKIVEKNIYGSSGPVINSYSSEVFNPAPTPKGRLSDERNVGMPEGDNGSQEDQIESATGEEAEQ